MAHIERRKLSDGTTAYRVVWTDPSGKRRRRQFSQAQTSRPAEEARKFKTAVESELLRGTYVDPTDGHVTFRTYVEHYRASMHTRPDTTDRFDMLMRRHVFPLIGDMRIGGIRRADIQTMVNRLAATPGWGTGRPLSASYVESILRIVSSVFNAAVLDKVIVESPCRKIKLRRPERGEVVIPTPEQVVAVADTVAPYYRALVLFAAGSGLRSGELRGLDTERLRVLERTVRVDRQLKHSVIKAGPHYYGPPKTEASYRTVPLAASYCDVVAEHLARYGTGTDGLVFCGRDGRPIRMGALTDHIGPRMRAQGLPKGSGLHCLRHYYISNLISQGLDILTVMRRAGHDHADETLSTYSHLWPDHADRTREASEASFPQGAARGSQGVPGGSNVSNHVRHMQRK